MWQFDPDLMDLIRRRLDRLYSVDQAAACLSHIGNLLNQYGPRLADGHRRGWDQRDVVLITYADQIQQTTQPPLPSLADFLRDHGLDQVISTLHLLPFYPSSSDGGFSVIDYRAVDPAFGTWDDVAQLGQQCDLMFDLVINHVSAQSDWFQEFLRGNPRFQDYFIRVDPQVDLSKVTRPRSLPLLTPYASPAGTQHVWTTFSADQVDLNFANSEVLAEMLEVLLFYVQHGARIVRLDAVAYLWKTLGTSCIHLWQTHEVIKLFRDVLNAVAPHVLLLTETNVPFVENISYFGAGDEAHMVYQFSLPPLILDALLSQDARTLMGWLTALPDPAPGTTWFNFTASHDGIGLRPLEGILAAERIEQLVDAVRAGGGLINTYRNSHGQDIPYEANITWTSALRPMPHRDDALHLRRVLTSQGLMLALRGMPAVYIHSLFGTLNDLDAVTRTGHARDLNRRKFRRSELDVLLADPSTMTSRLFLEYRRMLAVRRDQTAFHPDAPQHVLANTPRWLVALQRTSLDQTQRILVLANLSHQSQTVDVATLTEFPVSHDLLGGNLADPRQLTLAPCQLAWLT